MKNVFGKIKLGVLSVLALTFLLMPFFVLAEDLKKNNYGATEVYNNTPLKDMGARDPLALVQTIVRSVLSFVGIIFFLLTVYAGFVWIKARDNSSEVDKAKNIIESALYGIIIISMAFVISEFVFTQLTEKTSVPTTTPTTNSP